MDEPLSNLDAKLRVQMRSEIIKLHETLKTTTIYVTHDQTEAMTMANRIVIMKDGYVQQIGTPKEVYNHPSNKFVAGFIGSPSMNFFIVNYENGQIKLGNNSFKIELPLEYDNKEVIMGIRPEDISLCEEGIEVEASVVELLGSELIIHSQINNKNFTWKTSAKNEILPHKNLKIKFDIESMRFFDKETEKGIY